MEEHGQCGCKACKTDAGLTCGCGSASCGKSGAREGFWAEHGFDVVKIVISSLLLIIVLAFGLKSETTGLVLLIAAYAISAYEIAIKCFKGILNKQFLDENTLMIIASVTAFFLGEYAESVLIVLLYALGELLEDVATDNSRKKIAGLSELKSVTARLITEKGFADVPPESVAEGSLIEVRRGDRVPIDGILIGTSGEFDMKAITGESKPYHVGNGETVYSGSINSGDSVVIKTTKLYKDSTVEKIISMVEGANSQKAKSQKFITSFAKIYTPVIVLLAIAVAFVPPLFDDMNFVKWIYKALSFLVISCPCALVISVPLAFFTGIGGLAKNGVLVKGSNYMDALAKVNVAAFDKTGTLTKGEFSVESVKAFNGYTESEIAEYAAAAEASSNHPISKAICAYVSGSGENSEKAETVKELAGKGLRGTVDGKTVLVGNCSLMRDNGIDVDENKAENYYGTVVYVAINGVLGGEIFVCDMVKSEAAETIIALKKLGVNKTVMFSGDNKLVCETVGKNLGVDEIYSELLPENKAEKLNELKKLGLSDTDGEGGGYCGKNGGIRKNGKKVNVLFAGDGINDAPTLALSDVGVAMGALGSEVAVESADVVIMDDDIRKIPSAIKRAKRVRRKVIENIVGSLAIKAAIMALSVITGLPVWMAMFGDVGVMLLAVVNSLTA